MEDVDGRLLKGCSWEVEEVGVAPWRDEQDPAFGKAIISFGFVCVRSFLRKSTGGGKVLRVSAGSRNQPLI